MLENSKGEPMNLTDTLQLLKEQGQLSRAIATVWVPSQLVLLTQLFVPGSRKSDWMAALPYSLEESLSEPVENFHFVALNRDSQGLVSVAIVEHRWMKAWLQLLELHGLSHASLVPECFRVPLQSNQTEADSANKIANKTANKTSEGGAPSFFQNGENTLIRTGQFAGFAASSDWLNQIQTMQAFQGHLTERVEVSAHQLLNSQQSTEKLNGYSLRTEPYRSQSKGLYYFKQWRWAGLLLGLTLVTALTSTWMATQKLAEQTVYTQAQTQKLFKKMFPDVKRVIDIRTQTMTRLNQQSASQNAGLSAMQVLGAIEPILTKVPDVKIKKITWRTANKGLNSGSNSSLVLRVEAEQTGQLQKVISLSQQSAQPIKMTLELKNVSPTLAEGVLNVTAK